MIHEAYPQSRPVVIIVFANVVLSCARLSVRPSVPTTQNKANFKRKQCSLLARLWVWPSGSLMTPVLLQSYFVLEMWYKSHIEERYSKWVIWEIITVIKLYFLYQAVEIESLFHPSVIIKASKNIIVHSTMKNLTFSFTQCSYFWQVPQVFGTTPLIIGGNWPM